MSISLRVERVRPRTALTLVLLVTLTLLAPFCSKPFHIDDPLFVWAGEALARDPLHPCRIPVLWFETSRPMFEVMFNPPAVPYFVALVAKLAGTGERTLHVAFLLPALLFVAGTHRLATRWCRRPATAALAVALSPAFLVTATSVMADVWASALFVWSLALWVEGIDGGGAKRTLAAGAVAGLAVLSKYVGLAALPWMAVYALSKRRRPGVWLPALLVPLALGSGYELWAHTQIHKWPISVAGHVAGQSAGRSSFDVALIALAIFGGTCLAPVLLLASTAARRPLAAASFGSVLVASIGLGLRWSALGHPDADRTGSAIVAAQFVALAGPGLAGLLLAAVRLRKSKDPIDLALGLWMAEILVFATVLNWTTNARAFLPALPAIGILAARGLDAIEPTKARILATAAVLALSGAVGVALDVADEELARSARRSAQTLASEEHPAGTTVWFQGHWGFQYYAQLAGARPMEKGSTEVRRGDRVLVPMLNTNVFGVSQQDYRVVRRDEQPLDAPLRTMSRAGNVSFYGSTLGILPFGFGFGEPATTWVLERR